MIKKLVALLLMVSMLFLGTASKGSDYIPTLAEIEAEIDLPAAAPVGGVSQLPAKSAILIEYSTGRVLFEKDADLPMPPASITKIMTMLLVMEAIAAGKITLDDPVICSPTAASMGGSQIWFEPGETMTVDELMRAVATVSANDASVALGEHVAGSNDAFIAMMNRRASELKMTRTNFKNATGLDADGHETTARDIAAMSAALLGHPEVFRYTTIWMDELRGGQTLLVNTNKLVRFYSGATGLKTGTTTGAGHCLSATALRDDMHLIAVVLGSDTGDQRFSAARGLLDYGFANYELTETPGIPGGAKPVKVTGGVAPTVDITPMAPPTLLVPKGRGGDVTQQVEITELLTAPVAEGVDVGRVRLSLDGEIIASYPLITAAALDKMTFISAMGILIREACHIG